MSITAGLDGDSEHIAGGTKQYPGLFLCNGNYHTMPSVLDSSTSDSDGAMEHSMDRLLADVSRKCLVNCMVTLSTIGTKVGSKGLHGLL